MATSDNWGPCFEQRDNGRIRRCPGWFATEDDSGPTIHRCDACNRFADDITAGQHGLAMLLRGDKYAREEFSRLLTDLGGFDD